MSGFSQPSVDAPDAEAAPDPSPAAVRYREAGWWTGERLESAFARHLAAAPDRLAVADSRGRRLSRRELWDDAATLAGELETRGVGRGSAVVMQLPNLVDWQVTLLALLMREAVPAPVPMTTDGDSLRYIVDLIGARGVIAARRHGGRAVGEDALAAARDSRFAPFVLLLDPEGDPEFSEQSADGEAAAGHPDWLDQLMFTSSTTGPPKAVMHSADTLVALNLGFRDRHRLGPDTPLFMPSPLGHSVGTIHGARLALFTGAPLVLQERWDPTQAIDLVEEHRCEFTAAATPFLKDLVDGASAADSARLGSLRTFLCGGAPVSPALMEKAAERLPGTFVTVLWGMTEGGVTTCPPDSPRKKRGNSAGKALPGLELRILDPAADADAPSGHGELGMRGPGVFLGYLGQDDLYRSLLTADGFFRTGDLAEIDGDGYLHITGRLKDLIIRGGVNISPIPLENCLSGHPQIAEVAVVGVPDERLGERICAVVVPSTAVVPDLEGLLEWVSGQGLSRRLWPEALEVVRELPKTAVGKVRKPELRELLEHGDA